MIYFTLFFTFCKIGLFAFGGGLSTITLIAHEVYSHQWLTQKEFLDILTVSQMTPGPFSANVATYIGMKQAGVLGGIVATIGVTFPSFVIVIILVSLLTKIKNHAVFKGLVYGLLPVTVALIFHSAVIIAKASFALYSNQIANSLVLLIICFLLRWLAKVNILTLMVFGAVMALIIF